MSAPRSGGRVIVCLALLGCVHSKSSFEPRAKAIAHRSNGGPKVRIAVVVPLSGPSREAGLSVLRGVQLAADGDAGGFAGGAVLDVVDTESSNAERDLRVAMSHSPVAFIGGGDDTIAWIDAVTPYAAGPIISVSRTAHGARRGLFQMSIDDDEYGAAAARFALEKSWPRIVGIWTHQTPYPRARMRTLGGMERVFRTERQGKLVASVEYSASTGLQSSQTSAIQAAGDVVLMPDQDAVAMPALGQLRRQSMTLPVIGGLGWTTPPPLGMSNLFLLREYCAGDANALEFDNAFRKKFEADADQLAALGYDAVRVVAAAARPSQRPQDVAAQLSRGVFRKAGLITGGFTFGFDGRPHDKQLAIVQWQGTAFVCAGRL